MAIEERLKVMHSIAEKGLKFLTHFPEKAHEVPLLLAQALQDVQRFQELAHGFFAKPDVILESQQTYWQGAINLFETQFTQWQTADWAHLSSEEIITHPFFNIFREHHSYASKHFYTLIEHLQHHEPLTGQRVKFLLTQYLEALSPENFIWSNPQVMAETIASEGDNLLRGLEHLFTDLEKGFEHFSIKMTDPNAFQVGENLACTPGKVIFENELMQLIQYTPTTTKVHAIPFLMIPPWINKYYILDLSPHNSLVRWLVSQGLTVFMISWVNPDKSLAHKSFEHYLHEGPCTAIEVIQKQLQVKQVNALGFCVGGTLLSMLLAYYKAKKLNPIRSATFLATLIDFSDPGELRVFLDEEQIKNLELRMHAEGYLDGRWMANAFNSLRAADLIWAFFRQNYLQGQRPAALDMLYWNSDNSNLPATLHSQFLRWMYLNNDLIKPNKIVINTTALDVTQITTPSFFISTNKDHIAKWQTTYLGYAAFKGKKRFVLGGSGHIAGIINSPSFSKYGYETAPRAYKTYSSWLKHAKHSPGSWWPEWFEWLATYSGQWVTPCILDDQAAYPPLMNAPGSYVLKTHLP